MSPNALSGEACMVVVGVPVYPVIPPLPAGCLCLSSSFSLFPYKAASGCSQSEHLSPEHLLSVGVGKCRRTGSGSSNTRTRPRTWLAATWSHQGSHASLPASTPLDFLLLPEDSLEFPEFVLVFKGSTWLLAQKTHFLQEIPILCFHSLRPWLF